MPTRGRVGSPPRQDAGAAITSEPAHTEPPPLRPGAAAVVLLAGGDGRRVAATRNKALLPLAGLPVLAWSLRTVARVGYVGRVVVVLRPQDRRDVEQVLATHGTGTPVDLVEGGATRHGSEWNALSVLAPAVDDGAVEVVAIHDSARPLADGRLFADVLTTAATHGGAVPGRDRHDLVARDPVSPHPSGLVAVQTPQAFAAAPLLAAYRSADRAGFTGTDTASCVARYTDVSVHRVPAPATNLKITFAEDLVAAQHVLTARVSSPPGR